MADKRPRPPDRDEPGPSRQRPRLLYPRIVAVGWRDPDLPPGHHPGFIVETRPGRMELQTVAQVTSTEQGRAMMSEFHRNERRVAASAAAVATAGRNVSGKVAVTSTAGKTTPRQSYNISLNILRP